MSTIVLEAGEVNGMRTTVLMTPQDRLDPQLIRPGVMLALNIGADGEIVIVRSLTATGQVVLTSLATRKRKLFKNVEELNRIRPMTIVELPDLDGLQRPIVGAWYQVDGTRLSEETRKATGKSLKEELDGKLVVCGEDGHWRLAERTAYGVRTIALPIIPDLVLRWVPEAWEEREIPAGTDPDEGVAEGLRSFDTRHVDMAERGEEFCNERQPPEMGNYVCTRPRGHRGPHIPHHGDGGLEIDPPTQRWWTR